MIRCVLVATDGSDAALWAVGTAAELAASLGSGARLHVAAAVDYFAVPAMLGKPPPGAPDLLADEARDALEQAEAVIRQAGVRAETHLVYGDVVESVLACAAEVGADILVAGFRGRSRLATVVMGSVAGRLVRSTTLPVVIVRRPEAERG
ncbi:MAG TPA: universal stress protein [Candidatus Acidoferrales bacterium]|nr:universal stress protein [Candidatus Acidoferrales bacterium]